MDEPIKLLKGVNGQLEVYSSKIVIKRKGILSKMTQGFFKGDKSIYIKQITAVQVKNGGILTNGYIQFTIGGGIESTKAILAATRDENSVIFKKKHNDLVREIQSYIEKQMEKTDGVQTTQGISDEIRKLKALFDDGILTQDEFEKKKKQMLA